MKAKAQILYILKIFIKQFESKKVLKLSQTNKKLGKSK